MDEIKRGEIYYIEIPYATGHEMEKTRPGIVVSCNELNRTSHCVSVVMCSASTKRDLPEHITIRSTPVKSMALCEHIYTVDKGRVGRLVGICSKSEIEAVDIGIMTALGMGAYGLARPQEAPKDYHAESDIQPNIELSVVRAERDTYKRLYESLLDRMSMERRAGA